jgi:hypothetical protein
MPFSFNVDKNDFDKNNQVQVRQRQKTRSLELQKIQRFSDYSKAFIKNSEFRDQACDKLKSDKHYYCHVAYESDCELKDTDAKLSNKKKSKEYCLDYRFLELESECFPPDDAQRKGHEQFKQTEEKRYQQCVQYELIPRAERLRLDREEQQARKAAEEKRDRARKAQEKARAADRQRREAEVQHRRDTKPEAAPSGPRKKVYAPRK